MHLAVTIVAGICTAACFYLVYLGHQAGAGISWMFVAFGCLFGIPLIHGLVRLLGKRSAFARRVDEKLAGKQETRTTFVPHWFMMTAIIAAVVVILAAIILPLILKH